MTVPTSGPGAPPAKSNKTLLYVLVGCGGCLLLSGIAVVAVVILGATAAKKEMGAAQNAMVGIQVVALEVQISSQLQSDDARLERAQKVFEELNKAVEESEISSDEIEKLNKKYERLTKDNKLDGNEADEMLEDLEGLVR